MVGKTGTDHLQVGVQEIMAVGYDQCHPGGLLVGVTAELRAKGVITGQGG